MPIGTASEPFVFADLPELTYRRLPGMLADALPDDFGNTLIDAWMAGEGVTKSQITSLDRLAYMGKRGLGALEFKLEAEQLMLLEEASKIELGFPHDFFTRDMVRGFVYGGTRALIDNHRNP